MKKIRQRWYAAGIAAAAAGAMLAILLPGAATSGPDRPANNILARALDIELGRATPGPHEQLVSSGLLYPVLEASGALEERANAVGGGKGGANGASCASKFAGGGSGASVNIRVNQDCSLRRQSEEVRDPCQPEGRRPRPPASDTPEDAESDAEDEDVEPQEPGDRADRHRRRRPKRIPCPPSDSTWKRPPSEGTSQP